MQSYTDRGTTTRGSGGGHKQRKQQQPEGRRDLVLGIGGNTTNKKNVSNQDSIGFVVAMTKSNVMVLSLRFSLHDYFNCCMM